MLRSLNLLIFRNCQVKSPPSGEEQGIWTCKWSKIDAQKDKFDYGILVKHSNSSTHHRALVENLLWWIYTIFCNGWKENIRINSFLITCKRKHTHFRVRGEFLLEIWPISSPISPKCDCRAQSTSYKCYWCCTYFRSDRNLHRNVSIAVSESPQATRGLPEFEWIPTSNRNRICVQCCDIFILNGLHVHVRSEPVALNLSIDMKLNITTLEWKKYELTNT